MISLCRKYAVRPLRLVLSNSSILVLILSMLLLSDLIYKSEAKITLVKSPGQLFKGEWVYNQLPWMIINLSSTTSIFAVLLVLGLFSLQPLLTIVVMQNLKLIYQNARRSLLNTLHQISISNVLWFFVWLAFLHTIYICIIAVLYLLSLVIWKYYAVNTIILVLLVVVILFPLFRSMLSIGAKIAVIKMTWREKFSKIGKLFEFSKLIKVYIFYSVVLGSEFICVFLAPIMALFLFDNYIAAFSAATIALLVPVAAFRTSAFQFFLHLYQEDTVIQQNFSEYFKRR